MVVYLFFGIALLVGACLLVMGFLRSSPKQVAKVLKVVGIVLAGVVVVFLAVTGRLSWALLLLPALLPWLLRLRAMSQMFKAARGPSRDQASSVESQALSMTLDHDTGEMDGTVIDGPFEGQRLSDMDAALLLDLYRWCTVHDPDGARLLEAYLDRTLGAEWREAAGAAAGADGRGDNAGGWNGREPPSSEAGMTREEACSILGVEPGANADEIRAAHRRLMQHAHPDRGGSAYLAAKINAAKDFLLDKA